MDNTLRICRASRRLRWTLIMIFIAIPTITALVWLFINQLPQPIQEHILPPQARLPLPPLTRLLGFAVSLIPAGVAMYGTFILIRLFRLYETGQIFRPANVSCYRRLSRVLMAWFAAGILTRTLTILVLTLHNPPGQRILSIGLGSPDLTALLIGLILAVVAWVMEEGRRLQEEQDLTI